MNKHLLWDKVNNIIQDIRPFILQEGGDLELVSIDENNTVVIRFLGACVGCALLDDYTLQTITTIIQDELPIINKVIVEQN